MEKKPSPGDLYRHYKSGIYQVITMAKHSQTREDLVVYQAMQGDFRIYAEPLALFTKEINRAKYPQAVQKHRFEHVDREMLAVKGQTSKKAAGEPAEEKKTAAGQTGESPSATEAAESPSHIVRGQTVRPASNKDQFAPVIPTDLERNYEEKRKRQMEEREQRREQFRKPQKRESATDELQANPNLLRFLDTDTYEEKYQVLTEIQGDMTNRLIDDIAVVLDVVIPEGDISDRYAQLKNIILTRQRFEQSRFR